MSKYQDPIILELIEQKNAAPVEERRRNQRIV